MAAHKHRKGARLLSSLIGTFTFIPKTPLTTVKGRKRVEIVVSPLMALFIRSELMLSAFYTTWS